MTRFRTSGIKASDRHRIDSGISSHKTGVVDIDAKQYTSPSSKEDGAYLLRVGVHPLTHARPPLHQEHLGTRQVAIAEEPNFFFTYLRVRKLDYGAGRILWLCH